MPMEKNHFFLVLLLLLSSYATAQNRDSSAPPPPTPYGGFNQNFNPSMAIIIIILITAFFFMGFFSIYLRQCAGERNDRSVRPTTGAAVGRSRRAPKGLDPTVIESFPTFIYSVVKGLKIGKGTLECAVCLNEFEDDETLRLLPKCDHVFHPECIDAWLSSHVTCPVCRANLVPDNGETSAQSAEAEATESAASNSDSDDEVAITVNDDQTIGSSSQRQPDVINPNEIPYVNRPGRLKSARFRLSGKFPRSHSTGHSVVQPGENCERFTLRLPDDIRKKIVNGKLNRTTSLISFPAGYGTAGSSRKGYRGSIANEGSSRGRHNKFWRLDSNAKSDRWVFSMAPPFLSRTGSIIARSPKDDGEGSSRGKKFMTSVKSFKNSIDCISAAKVDGTEQSSTSRPPV